LYDVFAELGLLQICYDLGKVQESGKEVKKEEWIAQIIAVLKGKDEETKQQALAKLFAYGDCMKAELFKYAPSDTQPFPKTPFPHSNGLLTSTSHPTSHAPWSLTKSLNHTHQSHQRSKSFRMSKHGWWTLGERGDVLTQYIASTLLVLG
jgi:hypothetical protein